MGKFRKREYLKNVLSETFNITVAMVFFLKKKKGSNFNLLLNVTRETL